MTSAGTLPGEILRGVVVAGRLVTTWVDAVVPVVVVVVGPTERWESELPHAPKPNEAKTATAPALAAAEPQTPFNPRRH